jgi:hypothetical protein
MCFNFKVFDEDFQNLLSLQTQNARCRTVSPTGCRDAPLQPMTPAL